MKCNQSRMIFSKHVQRVQSKWISYFFCSRPISLRWLNGGSISFPFLCLFPSSTILSTFSVDEVSEKWVILQLDSVFRTTSYLFVQSQLNNMIIVSFLMINSGDVYRQGIQLDFWYYSCPMILHANYNYKSKSHILLFLLFFFLFRLFFDVRHKSEPQFLKTVCLAYVRSQIVSCTNSVLQDGIHLFSVYDHNNFIAHANLWIILHILI